MAAFLIDEDVAAEVASILRSYGHDAITVDALQRKGSKDDAVLWLAARSGRTVVTHNYRDFTMLHRAWHRWGVHETHPGILIPRQHVTYRPLHIAQKIQEFVELGHPTENELWVLEPDSAWHRFDIDTATRDTRDV